jgi:hypothetical protein
LFWKLNHLTLGGRLSVGRVSQCLVIQQIHLCLVHVRVEQDSLHYILESLPLGLLHGDQEVDSFHELILLELLHDALKSLLVDFEAFAFLQFVLDVIPQLNQGDIAMSDDLVQCKNVPIDGLNRELPSS